MNKITEAYSLYVGSIEGFVKFHNEVINMPRDSFKDANYTRVQVLASYLLLLEERVGSNTINYKETMRLIAEQLDQGKIPIKRDMELEDRYFRFKDIDIHYKEQGRMFRHLMQSASFFGLIEGVSRQKKRYNFKKCKEFAIPDKHTFLPIVRNNLINLNVKTNDFFDALKNIDITETTDYRPTYSIVRYLKEINRPATKFELSILFGRIDKLDKEEEIIERGLSIGQVLPTNSIMEQKKYFFDAMDWKYENGQYFKYKTSQEPYFKFNLYLLYMIDFGILKYNEEDETYELTNYSLDLLDDDISFYIADLEKLLEVVDDYDAGDGKLSELIITQRSPDFIEFIKNDSNFVEKMNERIINNVKYHKNGQRKRNKLISELAKILAGDKCQYKNDYVFKKDDGRYYTEAHHIIHFNEEDGPDITNNLVVLGPEPHTAIHQGSKEVVDNVYFQLVKNGILEFKRFEEMIEKYNVLNENQIELLYEKKILTRKECDELLDRYNEYF